MADDKTKAMLANMSEIKRKTAETESLVFSAIGEAVCNMLRDGKPVLPETVIAEFEKLLTETPSARGKCSPDQDVSRMRLESAIKRLHDLGTT